MRRQHDCERKKVVKAIFVDAVHRPFFFGKMGFSWFKSFFRSLRIFTFRVSKIGSTLILHYRHQKEITYPKKKL